MRPILWTLLGAFFVACLLAWIGSVLFANNRIEAQVTQKREAAQVDARLSAANIDLRLGQARSVLQTLAMDQRIVATLSRFGPDVQRSTLPQPQRGKVWMADPDLRYTSERLTRVVNHFGLNTLWLTNAAGDAVAEGHADPLPPFIGTNYADRDYFKAAQIGQAGRQFAVGRTTNVYGLLMSEPVLASGQFVGMVGIGLSIPKLGAALESVDAVVTDDLGVIVLAKDPSLLMTTMPDATVNTLSEEARNGRYKRVQFDPAGLQTFAPSGAHRSWTLRQFSGSYVMASHATEDGALRVYTLRDLGAATAHYQRDQLDWFALLTLLIVALALLLAGIAQYLITTESQRSQLVQLNRALVRETQTDALTGCANRRHFLQALEHECERAHRYGLPLSLLSLDIDHFKRVNDTWGHAAGDAVLKQFVATVQGQLRQADLLGRVGGEEFSVLLPHTSADDAAPIAERIRAAIEASPVWFDGHRIDVTVSIGGTQRTPELQPATDQLLAQADQALYAAKQGGRNRMTWYVPATT